MDLKGQYIVFEGVDGSGKSTQAELLVGTLKSLGIPVILTREPGSKWINLNVRTFVLSDEPISPSALELMLQADRAEHTAFVLEQLQKGFCVVSDRSFLSGLAYALAHDHSINEMVPIVDFSVEVLPDTVFFLDCSVVTSQLRLIDKNSATREEKHGPEFREKVRAKFLEVLFSPIGRDLEPNIMRQFDDVCTKHRISTENRDVHQVRQYIKEALGLD